MPSKDIIIINNKQYSFTSSETIIDVCSRNNIFIPTLCKHPDLSIQGKCRVCLVEIKGRGLVTSCSTPAENGMVINTNSEEVTRSRQTNLEMIYAEHIEKCGSCIQEHNCALKRYAARFGLSLTRFHDRKSSSPIWQLGAFSSSEIKKRRQLIDKNFKGKKEKTFRQNQLETQSSGFVEFDSTKCIDCGICTEVCRDKQTVDFYETVGKGYQTQTKPTDDESKDCVYCGQCIVHCPVGAIQGVPHWPKVEELLKNKKKHGKLIVGKLLPLFALVSRIRSTLWPSVSVSCLPAWKTRFWCRLCAMVALILPPMKKHANYSIGWEGKPRHDYFLLSRLGEILWILFSWICFSFDSTRSPEIISGVWPKPIGPK